MNQRRTRGSVCAEIVGEKDYANKHLGIENIAVWIKWSLKSWFSYKSQCLDCPTYWNLITFSPQSSKRSRFCFISMKSAFVVHRKSFARRESLFFEFQPSVWRDGRNTIGFFYVFTKSARVIWPRLLFSLFARGEFRTAIRIPKSHRTALTIFYGYLRHVHTRTDQSPTCKLCGVDWTG